MSTGLFGRRPVVMTVLSRVGGVYPGDAGDSVSAPVVVVVEVGTAVVVAGATDVGVVGDIAPGAVPFAGKAGAPG